MNTKKYKKAPVFSGTRKVDYCSGSSQQKFVELDNIENDINNIRVALTRIESTVRKMRT